MLESTPYPECKCACQTPPTSSGGAAGTRKTDTVAGLRAYIATMVARVDLICSCLELGASSARKVEQQDASPASTFEFWRTRRSLCGRDRAGVMAARLYNGLVKTIVMYSSLKRVTSPTAVSSVALSLGLVRKHRAVQPLVTSPASGARLYLCFSLKTLVERLSFTHSVATELDAIAAIVFKDRARTHSAEVSVVISKRREKN